MHDDDAPRARFAPLALALVVSAALLGCGGGGGASTEDPPGGDSGQPGADYFPTPAGAVWHYTVTGLGAGSARVTGTRTVDGRSVLVIEETDTAGTTETLYERRTEGVFEVPAAGADAFERALAQVPLLPSPLVSGRSSVPLDQAAVPVGDIDGDGRDEQVRIRAEQRVLPFETVTVAAGTFTRSARVRTVITQTVSFSRGGADATITGTLDDWFAPDVGPVKSQFVITGPGGTETSTYEVRAFGVATRRSEAVAPTIVERLPASDSLGTSAAVRVAFSEEIDRVIDAASAITVTGPDGQPIAGVATWVDDRTLNFAPALPPTSGVYTVTLADTLQDLATNRLAAPRGWTFGVDVAAPAIVAVSPADGSVGVATDVAVQIDFDEAPAPSSINDTTVRLTGPAGAVPATVTLQGTRVTLVPTAPLQRAVFYEVRLDGVVDATGNLLLPSLPSRFQTANGRLALPVALPGADAWLGGAAAADLDGDGRQDVVSMQFGTFGSSSIVTWRQRSDGTLSLPESIPVSLPCALFGVLPADMNADGRVDLVVSTACGVQVLQREATGSLIQAVALDVGSAASQTQRVRGAARPGLVTLPVVSGPASSVAVARVWRQGADGAWSAPEDLVPLLREFYGLRVADVNGDGLDDLVMWGLLASADEHGLEVRLQRLDGSFGSGTELTMEACSGVADVAVGDVNGDALADLVAVAGNCSGPTRPSVRLQIADGGYAAPVLLDAASYNMERVQLADMDGDGRTDIVALHLSEVGLYLQQAGGTLAAEVLYTAPNASSPLVVADFNGDGRNDVLTSAGLMLQQPTPVGSAGARRARLNAPPAAAAKTRAAWPGRAGSLRSALSG